MLTVVLVVHLLIAAGLVGTILMQRSEGGALGMGGGSGSGPGLVSSRAAGNLLTRTTAILAAGFFCTSLALAIMANNGREKAPSILDEPVAAPVEAPVTTPAPAPDAAPAGPVVPLSK